MDIITLTTDFGANSGYPAAMKGEILKINPDVNIIDISHSIKPQNITHGAYVLYSIIDNFSTAIHVGVVDPGVGGSREALIFNCEGGILIGPDNGLLVPAAKQLKIGSVIKITNDEYFLKNVTPTFHGRDIFAPVAAHISKGIPIEEMGENIENYLELDIFELKESDELITGRVLNIDSFGNIITNIPKKMLYEHFELGTELKLTFESESGHFDDEPLKIPLKKTYDDSSPGELIALISSSGFLELAINQGNAYEKLKIQISDEISLQK
jgi:S-adenosylmethionine hydrolase